MPPTSPAAPPTTRASRFEVSTRTFRSSTAIPGRCTCRTARMRTRSPWPTHALQRGGDLGLRLAPGHDRGARGDLHPCTGLGHRHDLHGECGNRFASGNTVAVINGADCVGDMAGCGKVRATITLGLVPPVVGGPAGPGVWLLTTPHTPCTSPTTTTGTCPGGSHWWTPRPATALSQAVVRRGSRRLSSVARRALSRSTPRRACCTSPTRVRGRVGVKPARCDAKTRLGAPIPFPR